MQSTRDHRSTLGAERRQGVPLLALDQCGRLKQYESGAHARERESITLGAKSLVRKSDGEAPETENLLAFGRTSNESDKISRTE